jgi:hypothetical protein
MLRSSQLIWFFHPKVHERSQVPLLRQVKGKSKVRPITGHEGLEGEQKYNYTLSLTSAPDGVGGQLHAPAALTPEKSRYPLYRGLGRPQDRSGRVRKISLPPGFDPRTIQPIARRYTDCAIQIPILSQKNKIHFLYNPISSRQVLILSSHTRLSLPGDALPSGFPINKL